MRDERWAPASCLMQDGSRALIAGGYSYPKQRCVASISLFDSRTGKFSASRATLPYPADFVLAAPLPNGKILLTGGFNDVFGSLDTAALYDPARDSCTPLQARMHERRELAQAIPLLDGRVLITGGLNLDAGTTLADAEIYDPAAKTFDLTERPMSGDRFGQAACRLADGRVLIVGGTHWNLRARDAKVLASAELYDASQNRFYACKGSLIAARDRPTATLLPSGKVLIAGGQGVAGEPIRFAELFDPATETFTRVRGAPLVPRMAHSAVSIPDGHVLLCGGWDADARSTTATCALYDAKTNQFSPAPSLPFATHDLSLIAFPNGMVLAAGGKFAHGNRSASNDQGAVLRLASIIKQQNSP